METVQRYIIYGLVDPRTDEVRYIGRSTSGLKRPKWHAFLYVGNTYKNNWIKQLRATNLNYTIVILETLSAADLLDEAEKEWIAFGRKQRWPLTNLTEGGGGLLSLHPDIRKRISVTVSKAKMGHVVTPETREKIRQARKRQQPCPEANKIGAAKRRGRVVTEATREKLRIAHAGRKPSEAARIAAANFRRGQPVPEAVRRKISASVSIANQATLDCASST